MPYPHVIQTETRRLELDPILKLIRETPLQAVGRCDLGAGEPQAPSVRIRRPVLSATVSC